MNSFFLNKSPGTFHKMGVFIILLSLLAFTRGEITITTVVEGDYTQLNFSYPCANARVTLRNGYITPFYDSANPESVSLPEHRELSFQSETESSNCLLQLKINPVLRSDEGGYILTAYDSNGNILEDPRIGLRVDYPPGKASCEWGEEDVGDDFGSMLCKAPAGSMPGQIACYQNGIRLPPVTTPTEVGDILQQTIWVRYSQTSYCCASLQDQPIDRCTCNDFVWDPLHNGTIIIDPCAAPQQDSTSSQSPNEDNISFPTIATLSPVYESITEIPVKNNAYISLHRAVFVLLVMTIVALCVVLTATFRKICKITKHRNIIDKQRNDYTNVPTVEVKL
ncbi:uncharacterized protein LOC115922718 [Strongylocentrotus purpuratus]|uniref:Uncharacterized protein n=1 Tax=Strongylocentrotus purpuratus TaxID=7668 RepID=A0A7M7NKY3_STRPU|nr:uncharacterized protein LOC115922718 [Strongylocentrotus purpuratus]